MQHDGELYATRYPELKDILRDAPELPKGNRILANWIDSRIGVDLQRGADHQLVFTEGNVVQALIYLVDKGNGRFELNAAGEKLLADSEEKARAGKYILHRNSPDKR